MSIDYSITKLLNFVVELGGSDLFLAAGKTPFMRLHGELRPLKSNPITEKELLQFLADHLPEQLLQQGRHTGDMDAGITLENGRRFRINFARQQGLCSIVARPLPFGHFNFEDLGLPTILRDWSEHRSGIVLVTGATGSGKSTTLAAIVHYINQMRRAHIITIEDPIEFVHSDIRSVVTQREVGNDTKSFSEALRRVLRQSPDVIMIGEMRDQESIRVAMSAALTGHLVISTIHTIDAAQTLQRVLSFFPEEARLQVANDLSISLRGILSQRLIPTIDGEGRCLACEVLNSTSAVAQLLRERRLTELEDLMRSSRTEEICTFNSSLLRLVRKGAISGVTAELHSTNVDELKLMVQGMTTNSSSMTQEAPESTIPDIHRLLQSTLERGASDLHLTVGRTPLIRIRGELQSLINQPLSASDMRILLNSIMSSRQRMNYELEKEVDFSLGLSSGARFRVNAYFQRGLMAASLRSIPSSVPSPEQMMIPEEVLRFSDQPHGLVLVVGPTGSGKSTTLACLIDRINQQRRCRILTVEDPIEFIHTPALATIDQRELYSDTLSFASALKYVLRQDPDVILVGEMRDQETIASALTAAETGHLVFATLHTNDAIQTIDRIIDVFPSHQQSQVRSQLASSIVAVVSQRLLRHKDGRRRIPAFEIMIGNTAIRNHIRENKMHQTLGVMESSQRDGMKTLDMALKQLFLDEIITEEEAIRYMRAPQHLHSSGGSGVYGRK